MKKFLAGLLALFVFAVMLPISAEAQTCRRYKKSKSYAGRSYNRGYNRNYNSYRSYNNYRTVQPRYNTAGYVYQRPSFYRRHRNLINLGVATGGGALIGALAGGKKGAGIGALIGAGSGALYTYVLNKKKRRY